MRAAAEVAIRRNNVCLAAERPKKVDSRFTFPDRRLALNGGKGEMDGGAGQGAGRRFLICLDEGHERLEQFRLDLHVLTLRIFFESRFIHWST